MAFQLSWAANADLIKTKNGSNAIEPSANKTSLKPFPRFYGSFQFLLFNLHSSLLQFTESFHNFEHSNLQHVIAPLKAAWMRREEKETWIKKIIISTMKGVAITFAFFSLFLSQHINYSGREEKIKYSNNFHSRFRWWRRQRQSKSLSTDGIIRGKCSCHQS